MDDNEPLPPSRSVFASRFFNQVHHFKKLLLKYWWIPLLTIGAGEGIQILLLKHQPQAFVSEGKMIVNVKLSIPNANVYSEEFNNFFGTQVALMQIRSVIDRVNLQLQSTKPDLHRVPVNIEVTLSPKTSIFNLQAVGADPSYVQAYLQETMDEYIKLKKDLLSNATTATQSTMEEELRQIAVQLESSKLDVINYQSSNSVVLLQPTGGNSAADRLAALTKELAEDRSELQMEETLTLDQNLERMQGAFPVANFSAQSNSPSANTLPGADTAQTGIPSNLGGFEQAYLDAKQQLLLSKVRLKELECAAITNTAPEIVALSEEMAHEQNLLDFYQEQSEEQMKNRQHTLQLKIADLEQQISEWEPKAVEVSRKLSDYEALKETHQRLQNMYDQMQANLQTLDVNKGIGQESVTVLEPAAPAEPVPLEKRKRLVMAGLIGLILGIGILVFASQLDDRPSSFAELQQLFDLPVIGQIPLVKGKDRNPVQPVLQFDDDRYALIETYRSLRSAFLYKDSINNEPVARPKSIVITSAVPNEGKTVTSANFAITLAQAGAKVLLIDADLRRGALNEHFSAVTKPGLAEVLAGQCNWTNAIVQTSIPNLHLLPRGTVSRQSHNLFAASGKFLADIDGHYDYHIFDTAPVMVADDVLSLAPNVDGLMMVIRAGFTSARVAHIALDLLGQRRVNVIGIVFNAVHPKASTYNYARFKEYYAQPETA
jgi:succinoglycan biosynthesis transport protein ExoP